MSKLKIAQEAVYNTRWKAGIKNAGLATDEEIAKAVLKALESAEPVPVTYDDIKAGDIIKIDYGYGFSVGVALYEEPLYDDPARPERMWRFDGMDYLGCSTGNWMMGGGRTRISELEFSELDEKARGWKRKEQEERDEQAAEGA